MQFSKVPRAIALRFDPHVLILPSLWTALVFYYCYVLTSMHMHQKCMNKGSALGTTPWILLNSWPMPKKRKRPFAKWWQPIFKMQSIPLGESSIIVYKCIFDLYKYKLYKSWNNKNHILGPLLEGMILAVVPCLQRNGWFPASLPAILFSKHK